MKKILLFIFFTSISIKISAQSESESKVSFNTYNKYLIKLDSNVTYSIPTTTAFIKMVCAANTTNYNNLTKYFEVLTTKDLEQNIIEGKLRKNTTPMTEYIYIGKVKYIPIDNSNTPNSK